MTRTTRKTSAKEPPAALPAPPVLPSAGSAEKPSATCSWSLNEELAFAGYLVTRKPEQGQSGSFRMPIYQDAAEHIAHLRVKGAKKTGKACSEKYRHLKTMFEGVRAIKTYSGLEWDEFRGANIGPETESVWQELLAAEPKVRVFKNKGWSEELYQKMFELVPTKAKGGMVFNGAMSQSLNLLGDNDSSSHSTSTPPGSPPRSRSSSPLPNPSRAPSQPALAQNAPLPTPATPPCASNGKRVHRMLEPASEAKRPRLTPTAKGIIGLGEDVKGLSSLMHHIFQPELTAAGDATPKRKVRASQYAQNNETWLGDRDLVRLLRVLETDVHAADAYLAIEREGLRREWVKDRLGMNDM